MVVRIRVGSWGASNTIKSSLAAGLKIAALACFLMGVWIIAAGLSWAEVFLVQKGVFSHWQVWIAFGVALQLSAFRLNRQKRQLVS